MSARSRRRAKCKGPPAQVQPADMQSAVSILRVSTKRQLNEGEGIENQRRGNNAYIARKGYKFHKEFVLAESASDGQRTDFEGVLEYLVANRKEIQVAVFWKLDRISRGGVGAYYALKAHLARYGMRIEFATENIDASPTGELMESILAATARFENRLRVDRTIGVEKILAREGYWCRMAPLGFKNGRDRHGKPILVPDPERWPLIQEGLRRQLTGQHRMSEVTAWLRKAGLCSRKGAPLLQQTWEKICRNPVYGGMLQEGWTDDERVRARFDGPLTPEEWEQLQEVLDSRGSVGKRRSRKGPNPAFPLRHFLRCPTCGGPSRGYAAGKKGGRRFHYYDCKRPACGFRVPAEKAHEAFLAYLRSIRPDPGLLRTFREVVLEVWQQDSRERRRESRTLQKTVTDLAREKDALIDLLRRVGDNPSLLGTLQAEYDRIDRQLIAATADRTEAELKEYEVEEVVNRCLHFLENAEELWKKWPVQAKCRLQVLLFPEGLSQAVLEGSRSGVHCQILVQMANLPGGEKVAAPVGAMSKSLLREFITLYEGIRALTEAENLALVPAPSWTAAV